MSEIKERKAIAHGECRMCGFGGNGSPADRFGWKIYDEDERERVDQKQCTCPKCGTDHIGLYNPKAEDLEQMEFQRLLQENKRKDDEIARLKGLTGKASDEKKQTGPAKGQYNGN